MSRLISRELFHEQGDVLNIMRLRFAEGSIGSPHYNKGRTEVVLIEVGTLKIIYFDESLTPTSSYVLSRCSSSLWHKIPMNQIHQFVALEDNTVVLEILGGPFYEGCCVNINA